MVKAHTAELPDAPLYLRATSINYPYNVFYIHNDLPANLAGSVFNIFEEEWI